MHNVSLESSLMSQNHHRQKDSGHGIAVEGTTGKHLGPLGVL